MVIKNKLKKDLTCIVIMLYIQVYEKGKKYER